MLQNREQQHSQICENLDFLLCEQKGETLGQNKKKTSLSNEKNETVEVLKKQTNINLFLKKGPTKRRWEKTRLV